MGRSAKSKTAQHGKRQQPDHAAAGPPAAGGAFVAQQRCTCIPWQISPISAIGACPDGSVLCVARDDGSLEFWDCRHWCCAATIPGNTGESSVTALTWTYDAASTCWRLFSGGLDGCLVEWDLVHHRPKQVSDAVGGAVWDLVAAPHLQDLQGVPETPAPAASDDSSDQEDDGKPGDISTRDDRTAGVLVACASDDGGVRLLAAIPEQAGLVFKSQIGRPDARALCLAWSHTAERLYAGFSDGCIRVYDPKAGRELMRLTTALLTSEATDCIWSLAVLPAGGLASASSRGLVHVWETRFGTLVSTCQQHQADVTCVAATPGGDAVFAAGVDPSVAMLVPEAGTAELGARPGAAASAAAGAAANAAAVPRYRFSDRRRPHTRDVRAMTIVSVPLPGWKEGPGGDEGTDGQAGAERVGDGEGGEGWRSFLVTGGNDGRLVVVPALQFSRVHAVNICMAPGLPKVGLSAGTAPLLAGGEGQQVHVWAAGTPAPVVQQAKPFAQPGEACHMSTPPHHVADIKAPGHSTISCVALDPTGVFLALSTAETTHLFGIRGTASTAAHSAADAAAGAAESNRETNSRHMVARLELPSRLPAACAVTFCGLHRQALAFVLVLAGFGGTLQVMVGEGASIEECEKLAVPLPESGARPAGSPPPCAADQVKPCVSVLCAATLSSTCALIARNKLYVLELTGLAAKDGHASASRRNSEVQPSLLPVPTLSGMEDAMLTAAALTPDGSVLAAASADAHLLLFDARKRIPLTALQRSVPQHRLDALGGHVVSLSFRGERRRHRRRPGGAGGDTHTDMPPLLTLASRSALCHVDFDGLMAAARAGVVDVPKKRRRGRARPSEVDVMEGEECRGPVRAVRTEGAVVAAHWAATDRLVVVEGVLEAAQERLPAAFALRTFGS